MARLPYIQVAQDLIDRIAADLAIELGLGSEGEASAGWMVLRLWQYALNVGPDTAPPDGIILGAHATARVERQVRWMGAPGVFVGACVRFGLIEAVPGGLRIRGMDRYRRTWGNNHPGKKPAGNRQAISRKPAGDLTGSVPPDADADADADAKADADTHPPPPKREIMSGGAAPLVGAEEEVDHKGSWREEQLAAPDGFWGFVRACRATRGLSPEPPPADFTAWHCGALEATRKLGYRDPAGAIADALKMYYLDDDFSVRGWPTPVFMSEAVWRARLGAHPKRQRERGWA